MATETETEIPEEKQIAWTILEQMGGLKSMMILAGVHTVLAHKDGVSFKLPECKKTNYIKVTLTPMDVYTVEFGKISKKPAGYGVSLPAYKVVEVMENIYGEDLKGVVERFTGKYFTWK